MRQETFNLRNTSEMSTKNYQGAAEALGIIIKEISDLHVPENIVDKWKILLTAIRVIDHKLDHIIKPEDRAKFTEKLIVFLKGGIVDFSNDKELEGAMLNVEIATSDLEKEQKEFLYRELSIILRVTEEIKIEQNYVKFIELTKLEGQATAKIFLAFLPEEFKKGGNYHKLVHSLTRLGRVANSLDNCVDLPDDYKNGQVKIKPNVFNRVLLFGRVLTDSILLLKDIGLSKDLIRQFFKGTKVTIQNSSEKSY